MCQMAKFKNNYNLHNIKLSRVAVSADYEALSRLSTELKTMIQEKEYLPGQVFNGDTQICFEENA